AGLPVRQRGPPFTRPVHRYVDGRSRQRIAEPLLRQLSKALAIESLPGAQPTHAFAHGPAARGLQAKIKFLVKSLPPVCDGQRRRSRCRGSHPLLSAVFEGALIITPI